MKDKFETTRYHFLLAFGLGIVINALMEIAIYVYVKKDTVSWAEYRIGEFLTPLCINLIVFIVAAIIDKSNVKSIVKNYACTIAFVVMCTVVVTAHYEYPVLLSIFMIPVLWSVVFEDKLLCSVTHILCQIGILQLTVTSELLVDNNQIVVDANDLAREINNYSTRNLRIIDLENNLTEMSNKVRSDSLWLNIIIAIILVAMARLFGYVMLLQIQRKNSMLQSHEKDNMALEKQLLRDQMTGLYNHTAFYEFLDRCVKMKGEEPLTLAVIDIDDFKKVNDTYGHDNGDRVILALCKVLQSRCGEHNYVCRYGGEEFAVIFPNSTEKDARQVMIGCLEEFRSIRYDWHSGFISFSCGVFQCSPYRMNAEEFFQITDKLLYKAKHSGKNQVYGGI